jgi:hypothetical protein
MNVFYFKIFLLCTLFIWGCGSSRKLTDNPQPLGIIPFLNSKLTPEAEELNENLFEFLRNSGSFYLNILDTTENYYTLNQLQSLSDSSLKWILTGKFEFESSGQEKGKIPFLLFKPNATFTVQLTYRLYNREKKGWEDIDRLTVRKTKGGSYQLLEYDEMDPSLALNATERQNLRISAYQELSELLVKRIESKMNINR